MNRFCCGLFLLTSVLWYSTRAATTVEVDSIKGPICVLRDHATGKAYALSPAQSKYNVLVTDGLAQITLYQMYVNTVGNIDDIVYVFPLPHEASVHAMALEYQDSVYTAKIMEKDLAQQKYDSVVASGGTAALLLQGRPNVFQQHLANIAFKDTAYVKIKLTMPLKYTHGEYELVIPTMVASRYQSAGATPVGPGGNIWNPPADRDGQTLKINVLLQTDFALSAVSSPTHELDTTSLDAMFATMVDQHVVDAATALDLPFGTGIMLQQASTYPNKDFVLRFSRTEATQDFTVASTYDSSLATGYFYATIFPDSALLSGEERPNLDVVLMIDVSGSQSGWPLEKEKQIANQIVDKLLPNDKLTLLSFNTSTLWCFGSAQPVAATAANIEKAHTFISSRVASGSTELLNGVSAALSVPVQESAARYYIFLTDGFITNEDAIFSAIKEHPTHPTVFTFGAGNSLNRAFLDKAAQIGNGYASEVTQSEEVDGFVNTAWNMIASPQLKDITIALTGSDPEQLILPGGDRLYKGAPVTIYGLYAKGGIQTVTITGTRGDEVVALTKNIELASVKTCGSMIAQVWARQRIGQLRIDEGTTTKNKSEIIELSVAYQVLSYYTAFLAVDPDKATDDNSIRGPLTPALQSMPRDRVAVAAAVRVTGNRLTIELPGGCTMREFSVYDLQGRCIYKIILQSGTTRLVWDGLLAAGRKISNGKYVVKIRTSTGLITRMITWR